jgi:hypothetical protein
MMRAYLKHTLFLLMSCVAGAWQPTSAAEFECQHGGQTRRIEVRSGDAVASGACEMWYWRDATAPENGQVLWRANQDAAFCDGKAANLLKRLETGGWTCTASDQPAPSEPMQEAEAAPPRQSAPRPTPEPEPSTREALTPAEPIPDTPKQAQSSAPAEQPAIAPAESPPAAILGQVVEQTLRSVQEMYGGEFRAEGTTFGDLDGDGREDAAVLVTYQADRDDYVQYLVAYLFDGETFRSTDTKNVGGRFLDARSAEIRGIVDRSIVVDLQSLGGGEVCCETRRAAFVLKEGQLVEVDDAAGARQGRSSQGSAPSHG